MVRQKNGFSGPILRVFFDECKDRKLVTSRSPWRDDEKGRRAKRPECNGMNDHVKCSALCLSERARRDPRAWVTSDVRGITLKEGRTWTRAYTRRLQLIRRNTP